MALAGKHGLGEFLRARSEVLTLANVRFRQAEERANRRILVLDFGACNDDLAIPEFERWLPVVTPNT